MIKTTVIGGNMIKTKKPITIVAPADVVIDFLDEAREDMLISRGYAERVEQPTQPKEKKPKQPSETK